MDSYKSPLATRYTSKEIQYLFSPKKRYTTWRKLWISLAKAQKDLGLNISQDQIDELIAEQDNINFETAHNFEKKLKHDVMAHLHAYGELCPKAKPILHLGATSCFVTDNADLIIMKEGLCYLLAKLKLLIESLKQRANKYKNLPCLSYTHFQAAQPTTLGKRITLWLQDFVWDAERLIHLIETLPFLGAKGATGTQASFINLFNRSDTVEKLDHLIAKDCGFEGKGLIISGQTYPRKLDSFILEVLAGVATSAHKFGSDLRLLSHTKEVMEFFNKGQVGSSAMPYKRNPIHSERLCSIARFSISLTGNAYATASSQWLERSLDDSANRRLVLPEAFLATDAILNLACNLADTFAPNESVIESLLNDEMAHIITENILMSCVKKGSDRQILHEELKKICHKHLSGKKRLQSIIEEIDASNSFPLTRKELQSFIDIPSLIGRAPRQVDLYQKEVLSPLLKRLKGYSNKIILPSVIV
jgi:adenylosuccinate lyase